MKKMIKMAMMAAAMFAVVTTTEEAAGAKSLRALCST